MSKFGLSFPCDMPVIEKNSIGLLILHPLLFYDQAPSCEEDSGGLETRLITNQGTENSLLQTLDGRQIQEAVVGSSTRLSGKRHFVSGGSGPPCVGYSEG